MFAYGAPGDVQDDYILMAESATRSMNLAFFLRYDMISQ
jgi:hypothetical protein